MSVAEDVVVEKVGMHADERFGVQRAAHIVDVGFACAVESSKVASSEGIHDPGRLIARVALEEGLVCCGCIVFEEVIGGERIQRRRVERQFFFAVAEGGVLRGQGVRI